jgi:hypothetical protein
MEDDYDNNERGHDGPIRNKLYWQLSASSFYYFAFLNQVGMHPRSSCYYLITTSSIGDLLIKKKKKKRKRIDTKRMFII